MGTVISAPTAGAEVAAKQPLCTLETPSRGVAEVTAPIAGTIDQVFVSSGSFVPATSAVAEMVPSGQPLRGLIFVSAAQGKLIRSGMQVNLSPDDGNRPADYGSIRGAVLSVLLVSRLVRTGSRCWWGAVPAWPRASKSSAPRSRWWWRSIETRRPPAGMPGAPVADPASRSQPARC